MGSEMCIRDSYSSKEGALCSKEGVYSGKEGNREVREGGIIKNPSLLLRQIFANTESYRVKHSLVELLTDRFPPEDKVSEVISVIKEFA